MKRGARKAESGKRKAESRIQNHRAGLQRRHFKTQNSKLKTPPAFIPHTSYLTPRLLRWFAANARDLPWRRTLDPYAVWISEIMLQQTQVKTVIPYWERWMRALPDAAGLAAAPEQRVLKLWEGLGYYTRARNLQKAARLIVAQHGGEFPRDFDAVLALPGVGRYTAGAVCSIAFNQPAPILDGNVIRVLTRLFGIHGPPTDKVVNARLWQLATKLVEAANRIPPSSFIPHNSSFQVSGSCSALNQSLMELGALVCLPAQPKCAECPLRARCVARAKHLTAQLPTPKPRPHTTERRFAAFVIKRAGRFAVRQREAEKLNGGLWEFPSLEHDATQPDPLATAQTQWKLPSPAPLCVIKHSITRYRITVEAYRAQAKRGSLLAEFQWHTLAELHRLPFTSAHKKILHALASKG
ncbi:MAG: A/G-specific adenine glycosylase [Verrucomicrobia bacterium]|nr:A/G-specific adenine glycosylase [Verrucomicrobiota bacterium]